MSDNRKSLRLQWLWPAIGFIAAIIFVANSSHLLPITFNDGMIIWLGVTLLALILPVRPIVARIGVTLTAFFMCVPCLVHGPPLTRALLMCLMAIPLLITCVWAFVPPAGNLRTRLAYLSTRCGTSRIKYHAPRFETALLLHFIIATLVLAAALEAVKAVPAAGYWYAARWLAGGIMTFAFAEMITASLPLVSNAFGVTIPQLMQSPFLSTSIGEFWNKRWNPATSWLLRNLFYKHLARQNVTLALFVTFFISGIFHLLLALIALGRWKISFIFATFFFVQPLLIIAERRMNVRQWHTTAARVWTLTALAITCPLIIEPCLQFLDESWNPSQPVLVPTIAIAIFVIIFSAVVSLPAAISRPAAARA